MRALLRDLHEAGVEALPRPPHRERAIGLSGETQSLPPSAPAPPLPPTQIEPRSVAPPAPVDRPPPIAARDERDQGALFEMDQPHEVPSSAREEKSSAPTLEILSQEVAACTRCSELAATRTQTVFADGSPTARLVFLGEAPGADEDAQGVPFVGRAGKLLTDMIERGMRLRRSEVYIMNILKCRPPGNRNPLPHEARNCRPYLLRQIELVNPEFICCLGAVAAQNLLETTQTIGKLRGRFHNWRGIQVLCTYHPAYLLRSPDAKRPTWEDLKMLMEAMGLSAEPGVRNAE
jgi:DNA polymerase